MTLLSARVVASYEARLNKVTECLRKLGAATINDIADEVGCNRETCRRCINSLVNSGRVVAIVPSTTHICAMYSLVEIDDAREFDERHVTVSSWPTGQAKRDPLVAALFGRADSQAVRP